jgi:biopolymer transport protein ExbB
LAVRKEIDMWSAVSRLFGTPVTRASRLALVALAATFASTSLGFAQDQPSTRLPPVADLANLPRDFGPWGMFLNADPLVKGVLIGLVIASVVTWTVWLAKSIQLITARRRMRAVLAALASVSFLADAMRTFEETNSSLDEFVRAALIELRLADETMDPEGIKERIASRLERIEAQRGRQMTRGTGVLATIGATAPFVGLFGTVWGIMNSFIGISKSQTTNLAVVASGIAEALLATAFGLAAAIPAVVIYNLFSRKIAAYRALLADISAEVLVLVGRDIDRSAGPSLGRTSRDVAAAAE